MASVSWPRCFWQKAGTVRATRILAVHELKGSHDGAEGPPFHGDSQTGGIQGPSAWSCTPSASAVAGVALAGRRLDHAALALSPSHDEHTDEEFQLLEVPGRSRV